MAGRFISGVIGLAAALMLAACVPSFGPAKKPAGPNPVTGAEIEVTALDDVPAKAGGKPGAKPPAKGPDKPVAQPVPAPVPAPVSAPGAGTPEAAQDPAVKPRPRPGEAPKETPPGAAAEDAAPAAPPAAPAVPEAERTKAQIACEKKKGVWADAGNGLRACVTYTKDGGKSCRKGGDCDGECLARSGTCAPFKPLFGCNEILDEGGRRVTLCLD